MITQIKTFISKLIQKRIYFCTTKSNIYLRAKLWVISLIWQVPYVRRSVVHIQDLKMPELVHYSTNIFRYETAIKRNVHTLKSKSNLSKISTKFQSYRSFESLYEFGIGTVGIWNMYSSGSQTGVLVSFVTLWSKNCDISPLFLYDTLDPKYKVIWHLGS